MSLSSSAIYLSTSTLEPPLEVEVELLELVVVSPPELLELDDEPPPEPPPELLELDDEELALLEEDPPLELLELEPDHPPEVLIRRALPSSSVANPASSGPLP